MVNANYAFDMSAYETGIYFLKIENSNGIQYLKIIKK
jgi:hypothetical protein